MRPKLLRPWDLVAAIAVGALVTVGVSWALALYADPNPGKYVEWAPWPASAGVEWPPTSRCMTPYSTTGLWQWDAWKNLDDTHAGAFRMFVSRSGWPMPALESRLTTRVVGIYWGADDGPYDNDGTLSAGLPVPLHWCTSHAAGEGGWCSRRLPLRPILPGFLVNTVCAALPVAGLICLWRLQSVGRAARPVAQIAGLLAVGLVLNVAVSLGLWSRWQLTEPARPLHREWFRAGGSAAQDAVALRGDRAAWPVRVPDDWPAEPRWIGRLGEAAGVRAYEYTANGIPSAAHMWLHVSWAFNALDPHQKLNIVQAGWPIPSFQSEELIEVAGRRPRSDVKEDLTDLSSMFPKTTPLARRSVLCNVTLPGAPPSTLDSDPMPFVPVRPLWPGLVINTLLFSALAAVVWWTPRAIRTLWRRTAGACRSCGYDARGLAVCPECGAPCSP